MICDASRVTMPDGETVPAIDLFPGRHIVSPRPRRDIGWNLVMIPIKDRSIEMKDEVYRLLFSNGNGLTATPDQLVALRGHKKTQFRKIAGVALGDMVIGERSGVRVSLLVVGKLRSTGPARCVSLEMGGAPFVAEGVLCR